MTDEEYEREFIIVESYADKYNLRNSTWSVGHTNFESPHPFPHIKILTYFSDPFWGKPSGNFTEEILGNTWLDLWIAADKIMGRCGDKHHWFIEGFEMTPDGILTMSNGS